MTRRRRSRRSRHHGFVVVVVGAVLLALIHKSGHAMPLVFFGAAGIGFLVVGLLMGLAFLLYLGAKSIATPDRKRGPVPGMAARDARKALYDRAKRRVGNAKFMAVTSGLLIAAGALVAFLQGAIS